MNKTIAIVLFLSLVSLNTVHASGLWVAQDSGPCPPQQRIAELDSINSYVIPYPPDVIDSVMQPMLRDQAERAYNDKIYEVRDSGEDISNRSYYEGDDYNSDNSDQGDWSR
jgi:hypothetical protein